MELNRFRFFNPIRNRWIEARYRATKEEIAARYEKAEIFGEPWTPPDVGNTGDRGGEVPPAKVTIGAMRAQFVVRG
jgi:hypothetical protein